RSGAWVRLDVRGCLGSAASRRRRGTDGTRVVRLGVGDRGARRGIGRRGHPAPRTRGRRAGLWTTEGCAARGNSGTRLGARPAGGALGASGEARARTDADGWGRGAIGGRTRVLREARGKEGCG